MIEDLQTSSEPTSSTLPYRSVHATPSRPSRFVSDTSYATLVKEPDNPEWPARNFSLASSVAWQSLDSGSPAPVRSPRRNPTRHTSSKIDDHIFNRGFLEGVCSDVTVKAFGKAWSLHRIILDRSPFFSAMFSGPWRDNDSSTLELQFDDPNITLQSFEFVLQRIYGKNGSFEQTDLLAVLATATYLDLSDLVDQCTSYQLRTLSSSNVALVLKFVSASSTYGIASDRLREASRALLLRDGIEMSMHEWDGIPVDFVCEIVGHDAFFCGSEIDRYNFICSLLAHRRRNPEDTEALHETLCECVYYMHMTQNELKKIRADGIVDENVLFRALWNQVDLKEHIAQAHGSTLGVTQEKQTPYPIPFDDTCYIGDPLMSVPCQNAATPSSIPSQSFSAFPPFRFCAEFDRVSDLKEDTRVYSHTVFYAGSYWNIYIHNKVRARKTRQLGVYLHRVEIKCHDSVDSLPDELEATPSTPSRRVVSLGMPPVQAANSLFTPTKDAQATGGVSASPISAAEARTRPYVDHRSTISTYFKIYCPTRKGTSKVGLTEFRSAPDEFHRSQSWGWKSRGLCAYDEREHIDDGVELGNLRFMIVLGVV
ncbi:hypothetical protein PYCC9005_001013 [Savitreella phatthalungensis]